MLLCWFGPSLQLVAYYNGTNKEIVWSQTEKIQWPSGGPPLDNPPCVFSTDDPSCNDGTDSPLCLTSVTGKKNNCSACIEVARFLVFFNEARKLELYFK